MSDYKENLLRRLKVKCVEVNKELSEVNSIYEDSFPLFHQEVLLYCKQSGVADPFSKFKDKKEDPTPSIPDEFKSLYRKIAVKTHPDKTKDKGLVVEKYQEATKAKKDNKIDKLVSLAKDLKINLNQMSYTDIKAIEASIIDTEKKIQQIRSSYIWAWVFSPNKERSNIIVRFVMNNV
jgi:hypothetical protein